MLASQPVSVDSDKHVHSERQIQTEVLEELTWDARVRPNEIGVIVNDGVVTLTGHVDAYAKKSAAERAAHRVRGVRAVANEIEVRLPPTAQRMDKDIAAAVAHVLEWDVILREEPVEVTVADGWVTLRGEVEWLFQRHEAEEVIKNLAGVRGITNLLMVKPPPPPSDSPTLRERIERALVRMAETEAERIKVEVQGGKVTLHGTVRSWAERKAVEDAAWLAPGVTTVENHLHVIS